MKLSIRCSAFLTLSVMVAAGWTCAGEGGTGGGGGGKDGRKEARKLEEETKLEYVKQQLRSGKPITDDQKKMLEKANTDKEYGEYKEKLNVNRANIKEIFAKAEDLMKEKKFADAAAFYNSIKIANVSGAETEIEGARKRILEMEDLAKQELMKVEDLDLQGNYAKEVEILRDITRNFPSTDSRKQAERKLNTLMSRGDVAGIVEIAKAGDLEKDGKLIEAIAVYERVAATPRYENTLPQLQAKKRLGELQKDENAQAALKSEMQTRAAKDAPKLISAAKNFISNNKPKQAEDNLRQVLEKFPGTEFAEQAQKVLESLGLK